MRPQQPLWHPAGPRELGQADRRRAAGRRRRRARGCDGALDPRRTGGVDHGGTFSANPVSLGAGLAALEAWDDAAIERLNALGDHLRETLAGQGWSVTGRGSLLRVHVPDSPALWWRLYRAGVLIAVNGLACLSTPMDEDTLAEVAGVFEAVRAETP